MQKLTYMERLDELNLWTLEERRNRSDLVEVFKMAKNFSPIYRWPNSLNWTLTIEHVVIHSNWSNIVATAKSFVTSSQKELLIVGICWIKTAKSANDFKSKLESQRKRKMGLFLDWSLLGLAAVFHLWSGQTCELPVSFLIMKCQNTSSKPVLKKQLDCNL